jgi:hypothetical protein
LGPQRAYAWTTLIAFVVFVIVGVAIFGAGSVPGWVGPAAIAGIVAVAGVARTIASESRQAPPGEPPLDQTIAEADRHLGGSRSARDKSVD